jgi:UDP:flavonoid glycosyltransferase YjiC (YdhE family)
MACATLAKALALRGHHIGFAFRDLGPLAFLPDTKGYDRFQAPRAKNEGLIAERPVSYAEILLGCGYKQAGELTALVGGWRAILSQWKPDLVVADYAPTALVAARSLAIRRVTFGNGFFTPPQLTPIPPYRYDEPVDPARLTGAESTTLASVNAALAAFDHAPLGRLADVFDADEHFLCTFPELDQYQHRPATGYWGPRYRFDRGLDLEWPQGPGKRIFVYVKTKMPQLDALIDLLAANPHRVIAFIPGLDAARRARLASRSRIAAERPVRLDGLMRQCDLLVSHGGEIATGALLAGVPQLSFPLHYEQYLTSRRLEQVGSGAWMGPKAPVERMREAFAALLSDPRYANAAKAFARRYTAFSPAEQRRRIAARIDEILAAKSALPPQEADPILSRSPPSGAQE